MRDEASFRFLMGVKSSMSDKGREGFKKEVACLTYAEFKKETMIQLRLKNCNEPHSRPFWSNYIFIQKIHGAANVEQLEESRVKVKIADHKDYLLIHDNQAEKCYYTDVFDENTLRSLWNNLISAPYCVFNTKPKKRTIPTYPTNAADYFKNNPFTLDFNPNAHTLQ